MLSSNRCGRRRSQNVSTSGAPFTISILIRLQVCSLGETEYSVIFHKNKGFHCLLSMAPALYTRLPNTTETRTPKRLLSTA